tara:strand:+ start:132 stop:407 length:276 start_codon:yes stop_codon:yes gene_type:complete
MKFFPYRKFAFWYRTKITSAYNSQKRACHYLGISHGIMNRYCNGSDLPSLRFYVKSIRKCCDILGEDLNQTLLEGLALIPNDKPTEFDDEV